MLSFVPDAWLYYAVLAVLGCGVTTYVVSFIPLLPYRELLRLVGTLLTVLGIYFYGSYSTEAEWRNRASEMQKEIDAAKQQSKEANDKIKTVIVEKTKIIHDQEAINQNLIKQNAEKMDAQCVVVPEVLEIINKAASGK
jgi:hypothetical protein